MSNKNNDVISPIAAAVTGAVIGAGVAIAGAVALKDEKNRKKVKDAINEAKDKSMDYVDNLHGEVDNKKVEVTHKAEHEEAVLKSA